MSSTQTSREYTTGERALLLQTALAAIKSGLDSGKPLTVDPDEYPEPLQQARACFVTLNNADGSLRGCIGSLEPGKPLVNDVAQNAFAAAFRDPRFPPLRPEELEGLVLQLSVIGPQEAVTCDSEETLLANLRPGIDGLILQTPGRRATFLPAVWESLPQPRQFLAHLREKAGLAADYWSDTLQFWRYTTESFSATVAGIEESAGNTVNLSRE
ncbi:MAG: AmmeMemoRadiSam system protein A [Gammaproteobacteria bacterium]